MAMFTLLALLAALLLHFVVVPVLVVVVVVDGAVVSSIYHSLPEVIVDPDNRLTLFMWTLQYDTDLYINSIKINETNGGISSYNYNNNNNNNNNNNGHYDDKLVSSNSRIKISNSNNNNNETNVETPFLCFGRTCRCLSPVITRLLGIASFDNLQGDAASTFPPSNVCWCHRDPDNPFCTKNSRRQMSFVLPIPTSVASVSSILGLIASPTIEEKDINFSSNSITFVYFVSLIYDGKDYSSEIGRRMSNLNSIVANIADSLTDANGNPPGPSSVPINQRFVYPPCKFSEMQGISTYMSAAMRRVNTATNFEELLHYRWRVAGITVSDYYISCENELLWPSFESSYVISPSYPDTMCYHDSGSAEFALDPCCNTSLTYFQCCSPRSQNVEYLQLNKIYDHAGANCRFPDSAMLVYKDFLISHNNNNDPDTGCAAAREQQANDEIAMEYRNFMVLCNTILFGENFNGHPCEDDSDCYTSCFNKKCIFPYADTTGVFLKCYNDHLSSDLRTHLAEKWQISSSAPEEEWIAAMSVHWLDVNCYGPASYDLVWHTSSFNGELVWRGTTEDVCLAEKVCNWAPLNRDVEDENECYTGGRDKGKYFCGFCNGELCQELTRSATCFKNTFDPNICVSVGGVWDVTQYPQACLLPSFTTIDDCLQENICPNTTEYKRAINKQDDYSGDSIRTFTECDNRNLCVLFDITAKENCFTDVANWTCPVARTTVTRNGVVLIWEDDLNSGNGLCHAVVSSNDACVEIGGYWWTGRSWRSNYLTTAESCEIGYCDVGGLIKTDIPQNNCQTTSACSNTCRACRSRVPRSACVSVILNECECLFAGGEYKQGNLFEPNRCLLNQYKTRDVCEGFGAEWQSCRDLSLPVCQSCNDNPDSCPILQDVLECAVTVAGTCDDEEECYSNNTGECTDAELYNIDNINCTEIYGNRWFVLDQNCWGACVQSPPFVDDFGNPFCDEANGWIGGFIGCISRDITDRITCQQLGYTWEQMATNSEECERHGLSCRNYEYELLSKISYFSQKDPDDCIDCYGRVDGYYSWEAANWVDGELNSGSWKPYALVSMNQWGLTINFTKVDIDIEAVTVDMFASAYQSETLCYNYYVIKSLAILACDCIYHEANPTSCYDGSISVPAGQFHFCNGIANNLRVVSYDLTISRHSVPLELNCMEVNISLVSVQQYRKKIVNTMSADQLLQLTEGSNKHKDNNMAVIYKGLRVVGQLVSDGIVFVFDNDSDGHYHERKNLKNNFDDVNPSQSPTNRPSSVFTDVTICADTRSDVFVDEKSFPFPDFAYDDGKEFVIMGSETWLVYEEKEDDSDEDDEANEPKIAQYCVLLVNVQSGVYYLPINRVEDYWVGERSSPKIAVLILAVMDVFAACLSLWRVASFHFAIRQKLLTRITIQLYLFLLTFLFMSVRSIYLFMIYANALEDLQLWSIYFLYDLPMLLYFSTYSMLIFYWAEISTTLTQTAVIQELLPYCIAANALLYISFFLLIIIYYSLNNEQYVILVYRLFLSFISLACALSFFVFGRKLLRRMQESVNYITSINEQQQQQQQQQQQHHQHITNVTSPITSTFGNNNIDSNNSKSNKQYVNSRISIGSTNSGGSGSGGNSGNNDNRGGGSNNSDGGENGDFEFENNEKTSFSQNLEDDNIASAYKVTSAVGSINNSYSTSSIGSNSDVSPQLSSSAIIPRVPLLPPVSEMSNKTKFWLFRLSPIQRITWLTSVCTLAFAAQCLYLAVTAFYDIKRVNIALAPFLLTEFLPCILVIIILRPPISSRQMIAIIGNQLRLSSTAMLGHSAIAKSTLNTAATAANKHVYHKMKK